MGGSVWAALYRSIAGGWVMVVPYFISVKAAFGGKCTSLQRQQDSGTRIVTNGRSEKRNAPADSRHTFRRRVWSVSEA